MAARARKQPAGRAVAASAASAASVASATPSVSTGRVASAARAVVATPASAAPATIAHDVQSRNASLVVPSTTPAQASLFRDLERALMAEDQSKSNQAPVVLPAADILDDLVLDDTTDLDHLIETSPGVALSIPRRNAQIQSNLQNLVRNARNALRLQTDAFDAANMELSSAVTERGRADVLLHTAASKVATIKDSLTALENGFSESIVQLRDRRRRVENLKDRLDQENRAKLNAERTRSQISRDLKRLVLKASDEEKTLKDILAGIKDLDELYGKMKTRDECQFAVDNASPADLEKNRLANNIARQSYLRAEFRFVARYRSLAELAAIVAPARAAAGPAGAAAAGAAAAGQSDANVVSQTRKLERMFTDAQETVTVTRVEVESTEGSLDDLEANIAEFEFQIGTLELQLSREQENLETFEEEVDTQEEKVEDTRKEAAEAECDLRDATWNLEDKQQEVRRLEPAVILLTQRLDFLREALRDLERQFQLTASL